jgi:hypothetical protein
MVTYPEEKQEYPGITDHKPETHHPPCDVKIKYATLISETPTRRRKSASIIDFHGIFLCDFVV